MALQYFLFCFQVLFFHLLPLLSGYNHFNPTCPENFVCDKLGPLRFPFSNSTQPHCGLCMVECDEHSPTRIKLDPQSEQWFHVKSTPYGNFIKLYDPAFQFSLQGRNCFAFFYNLILPNSSSISYTIVSNITLYKCTKRTHASQEMGNYFRGYKTEPCGDIEVYYRVPRFDDSHVRTETLPVGCSVVHFPMRFLDNVSDTTNVFDLLTADFDLELHLSDDCSDCHDQGGKCESYGVDKFNCARAEMNTTNNSGKGKNKLRIILPIALATAGGTGILAILVFCFRKKLSICHPINLWKCKTERDQDLETFLRNYALAPKRYRYSELKKMTNSFETMLGQGGYGSVYRGKLQDGSAVAVKILKESKGNGEEFVNEVASISRTSHVNVVTLIGFCFQGDKKALVYEFMENGSLDKFIYGVKSSDRQLEWSTLYKIAVGIARGLEYLHRGCNTRILHFDIKPHNILLDENFCPRISDFGLAKLFPGKESILTMSAARGTIGFIAPEVVCRDFGAVSHKSDVYSYGMMVLEMVGGRKNVDARVDHASEIYFPHWIYTKLDQGEELGLSGIMNEEENKQARKMLIVSLWCIQTHPSNRPTITNVLEMLEGPLEALQMPPNPSFSRASSRENGAWSSTISPNVTKFFTPCI